MSVSSPSQTAQRASTVRRRSMSLRLRLVLLVLLIAVPVVALSNILVTSRANNLLDEDAKQQLLLTNRALSANTKVWLDLHLNALQAMVSLPEIASMDPAQQAPVLKAMATAYPSLYLFQTVDLNGTDVARSDVGAPKSNADQPWFQNAKSGKVWIELLLTRTTYKPGLSMAAPIKDAAGNIVGVGAVSSNLDDIDNQVFASVIGKTGYGYIVDAQNRVVAHPDIDQVRADFSSAPPVAALRNGTVGEVNFVDNEGVQWQAYVSRLENGWGVVVQEQVDELLTSARLFQEISLLVLGAGVILLVVLAWFVIGRALQPISTLTKVAIAAAEGDLRRKAPVERYDEVGILSEAFNTMIARLRELIGSLEQRIAARTDQLQASTDVGRAAVSILDTNQLLREVVNLITDRFGFYYTAVFLADSTGKWAVLREATGEAGRVLKERDHRLEVGGQSMVGTAMQTHRPRIALDVGTEAVRFANPLLPDTRSEIALPLVVGSRVLGALDVQSTQAAAFDEASAAVLQSTADQIAIALSNAQQFQQTQAALQYARRLYDASRAIAEAGDIQSVLAALLQNAVPNADRASAILFGPHTPDGQWSYLELAATWTKSGNAPVSKPVAPGTRIAPEQLPIIRIIEAAEPVLVPDIQTTAMDPEVRAWLQQFGAASAIGVPLNVSRTPLGVIIIGFRETQAFDPGLVDPLMTLASQAAIAMQNQRSLAEVQTTLQQLNEINRRLTGEAWHEYAQAKGGAIRKIDLRPGLASDQAGEPLPSAIAAPVRLRDEVIGMLRLEDAAPDRAWTYNDYALLEAVAGEVAIAVENARLMEQTERRAQRERIIAEISSRMFAANDLESIVRIASEELGRVLHMARTEVRIDSMAASRTSPEAPGDQGNGHEPRG